MRNGEPRDAGSVVALDRYEGHLRRERVLSHCRGARAETQVALRTGEVGRSDCPVLPFPVGKECRECLGAKTGGGGLRKPGRERPARFGGGSPDCFTEARCERDAHLVDSHPTSVPGILLRCEGVGSSDGIQNLEPGTTL